ncbi:hypothetical protein YC2023_006598 [Brassica napus]
MLQNTVPKVPRDQISCPLTGQNTTEYVLGRLSCAAAYTTPNVLGSGRHIELRLHGPKPCKRSSGKDPHLSQPRSEMDHDLPKTVCNKTRWARLLNGFLKQRRRLHNLHGFDLRRWILNSGDMNYISDGSPLTMVVVGVKRHSSGLDRVSSASLGYDHGHDESW